MPKPITIVGALLVCGACVAGGYWLGRRQAERAWEHTYYLQLGNDVIGMIKSIDHLSRSDSASAVQVLEKKLDLAVILAGPNEYHPRPLSEDQKAILQLVAQHRKAHPFSDPNHQGINKMVQTALATVQ
jgi:hypothetical protein